MIYVGLDLHKKTIQIAAVDYRGATLLNKKDSQHACES